MSALKRPLLRQRLSSAGIIRAMGTQSPRNGNAEIWYSLTAWLQPESGPYLCLPSLGYLWAPPSLYGCMALMFCPGVKCFQSALFRGDEASQEAHTQTDISLSLSLLHIQCAQFYTHAHFHFGYQLFCLRRIDGSLPCRLNLNWIKQSKNIPPAK